MSRVLQLDALEEIECPIGGRTFTLKPQRRAVLQRVLAEAFKDHETDEKTGLVEGMFKNFERQLPVFPVMFGYENPKSDDYKEALTHLQEWLSPSAAATIFKEWWALNGVEDFFLRAGMPLYPPNMVQGLKERFEDEVTS